MKMNMNRFSKLKMPKLGKRPMMMAITGIVIVFLFYFFFMRGSSSMSEGFREGANAKGALQQDVNKYNKMNAADKAAYDKAHPTQAKNIGNVNAKAAAKTK